MASARKRRVGDDNDTPASMPPRLRKISRQSSPKNFFGIFAFLCLSVCFFVVIIGAYFQALPWNLYAHGTNALDNFAFSLGLQTHVYAVVIDAGSTGSRVLAFTFHKSLIDGNLKLDDELFVQVKPGLSSFSEQPEKGASQMLALLERAKDVVPPSERGHTPLAMKATAGLRLLPRQKADKLIEEVREVFRESPFHSTSHSISIMDGTDEGLFSWFTVNFLRDRFGGGPENTVVALDLGGGSTQVTFALDEDEEAILMAHDPESVHEITAFHNKLAVYTHSYLGLGLMAARHAILTADQESNITAIHHTCINPIVSTEWEYAGTTYTLQGPKNPTILHIKEKKGTVAEDRPIVNFTQCLSQVKDYVEHKVYKPKGLSKREINAFSYYFDRAAEVGLIDEVEGGILTVGQYFDAAKSSCNTPNTDQPLMCLDLTIISVLLKDGFGLDMNTKLNLYKKIDNHEISWALGLAFHILENGL
ncbi:ectonucleoside triphosphate diphosphohydrolase 5-like isoform X2 [Neocloeon triangulifer]|uniref:ectonucleoside triphosphate diphosphohydrolase 5-like isoform X2 n=1 Tax=Neocloeon triangulifer TaxID=2078957 RepID=UPI00286F62EB|nr:ectonucleoside triphosphate diphosphohydrolase 5-like isoform X2 [Neocloeon triangulifer]